MPRARARKGAPCGGGALFLGALSALGATALALLVWGPDLEAAAASAGAAAPAQTDWAAALWERAAAAWESQPGGGEGSQPDGEGAALAANGGGGPAPPGRSEAPPEDRAGEGARGAAAAEPEGAEAARAAAPAGPPRGRQAPPGAQEEAAGRVHDLIQERARTARSPASGAKPAKIRPKTDIVSEPCTGECLIGGRGYNYSDRCRVANETQAAELRGYLAASNMTLGRQRVGASIAIHPPRFYAIAQFLAEYIACPPAVGALGVFLVFSTEADQELFRAAMGCLHPEVPEGAWTPVICRPPERGWGSIGHDNQYVAAYKKWHGIAAMMDLGERAPEYGLMLDAELLLYDFHAPVTHRTGCADGSEWTKFLSRIRGKEAAKEWVAARVSDTLKVYYLGSVKQTGKSFDQILIGGNAGFVSRGDLNMHNSRKCDTKVCDEVRQQWRDCLFSWWTDLPWMNLSVASRMMEFLSRRNSAEDSWVDLSTRVRWHRFEHIGYQQWTVLHEGFHFRDVTNLTGEAKWGSFLEDPQPNTSLRELELLMISGHALERSELGTIVGPPAHAPPVLIFHSDHANPRKNYLPRRKLLKKIWGEVQGDILKLQNRRDFTAKSIER